jgi:hypothetical protein
MVEFVLRILLRCSHRHITRPITPLHRSGAAQCGTYVVCLDCGTRLPYDWENMCLGRQKRPPRRADVLQPEWAKQANRRE